MNCSSSAEALESLFNEILMRGNFTDNLGLADITLGNRIEKTIDQSVFFLVSLKLLENLCKSKYMFTQITFHLLICAAIGEFKHVFSIFVN